MPDSYGYPTILEQKQRERSNWHKPAKLNLRKDHPAQRGVIMISAQSFTLAKDWNGQKHAELRLAEINKAETGS